MDQLQLLHRRSARVWPNHSVSEMLQGHHHHHASLPPLFLLCHFVQDLAVCADLSRQGKSLIIDVFFGVSSLPT
jgi:hypothetical protein